MQSAFVSISERLCEILSHCATLRLVLRDIISPLCVYFQYGNELLLDTKLLFKIGKRVKNFYPSMKLIQAFKVFW